MGDLPVEICEVYTQSVVLGPGLCYWGSDILCLAPFLAFDGTGICLATCRPGNQGKGKGIAVARVSLGFPDGLIPRSLPNQKFVVFHTKPGAMVPGLRHVIPTGLTELATQAPSFFQLRQAAVVTLISHAGFPSGFFS